jgi:RNA polymerase sigma-70 factor (ECF subfamily)
VGVTRASRNKLTLSRRRVFSPAGADIAAKNEYRWGPRRLLRGAVACAGLVNRVNRSNVEQSETSLVQAAVAGDRDARRELFERFREIAYRVAVRITGRHEDALDVVQDSFIRAFERLGEFQQESSFQTWLLRIVNNRALDLLRARKVRLAVSLDAEEDQARPEPVAAGAENVPSHRLEQRELAARLRRAIDALPAEQKAVFAMYATGAMTYGQIAEALGIPIGTVMSRLFHARKRLHEMLPDLAPPMTSSE